MTDHFLRTALLAAAAPLLAIPAFAHPGHDHSNADHAVWETPETLPVAGVMICLAIVAIGAGVWLTRDSRRKRGKK